MATINENSRVRSLTLATAIALSGASIILSSSWGWNLGEGSFLSYVFAIMLLGLAITEFLAPFYIQEARLLNDDTQFIISWCLLLAGITASVIAGQSLINMKSNEIEEARRVQSDAYQSWLSRKEMAAKKSEDLMVSQSELKAAKNAIRNIDMQVTALYFETAYNSINQNTGKTVEDITQNCTIDNWYKRKYCPAIRKLQGQIMQHQDVIIRHSKYLEAQQNLAAVETNQPGTGIKEAVAPGMLALALLFKSDPELIKAQVYFYLAICVELFAIALWWLLGRHSIRILQSDNNIGDGQNIVNNVTIEQKPSKRRGIFSHMLGAVVEHLHSQNSEQRTLSTPVPVSSSEPTSGIVEHSHNQNSEQHTLSTPVPVPSSKTVPACKLTPVIITDEEDEVNTLSVPDHLKADFDRIVSDLEAGQKIKLSFQTLEKTYGIKRKFIGDIRDLLVLHGYAQYDCTKKMVLT